MTIWILRCVLVAHIGIALATHSVDSLGWLICAALAGFAIVGPRRWPARLVRWLMAAEFLLAVADRFGWLGGPGSPGVSWGDWSRFVDYTARLTATGSLPHAVPTSLAVAATIAELGIGLGLIVARRPRQFAALAALLTGTYTLCMLATLPVHEVVHWQVYLWCAALGVVALARQPDRLDQVRVGRRPVGTGAAVGGGRTQHDRLRAGSEQQPGGG